MRKSNPPLADSAAPVARIIHAILIDQGLHHVEVSLLAGLGRGYLRDLFRGKSQKPNLEDLGKIADVLNVGISTLSQQGTAPLDKERGNEPYTEEHLALIGLWDILSKEGQERAIGEIAKLVLKYRRR